MPHGFAIAIDGPVASGKGTIAQRLADDLHGLYLNTGGMFRSVALMCIDRGLDVTNPEHVISVLPDLQIQIIGKKLILNGKDVTERVTEPDTASGASVVAVFPYVRKVLLKRQQEIVREAIAKGTIVVAEGRDTGTAVFPDAALKVYLTAALEIRAKRRLLQHNEPDSSFEKMLTAVTERDARDTGRKASPLPSNPEAHGYIILDSSDMTEEETLEAIKRELRKRKLI